MARVPDAKPNDIIGLPTAAKGKDARYNDLVAKLETENRIKDGAENLLQVRVCSNGSVRCSS
jgi:hypothetical protein